MPYTGATGDVDLNTHNIGTSGTITAGNGTNVGVSLTSINSEPEILATFGTGGTARAINIGNANGYLRVLGFTDSTIYMQTSLGSMQYSGAAGAQGTLMTVNFANTKFTGMPYIQLAAAPANIYEPYLRLGGLESGASKYWVGGYGYTYLGSKQPAAIGFYETSDSGNTVGNLIFANRLGTGDTAPPVLWSMVGTTAGIYVAGDLVSGTDGTGTYGIKTGGDIRAATYHVAGDAGIDATVSYTDTALGAKTLTFKKGILTAQT